MRFLLPLFAFVPLPALAQDGPLRFGDDETYVQLSPFIQVDALFAQDTPDGFGAEDTDLNVARAYVEAASGDVSGLFAYEFADGGFVRYVLATYRPTEALSVTIGQQDEPFSLSDLPGGKAVTFADGSETVALIPGDNVGLSALYDGGTYTVAGGVYAGDLRTGIDEEGVAFSGRATWNPVGRPDDDGLLAHLGAAVSFRGGADLEAGFSQGVGAGLLPRSVVSIGDFEDVDRIDRGNLEAAFRKGSVSMQAEATYARVARDTAPASDAYGGYVLASWLVTGERRPYSGSYFTQIAPDRPVPEGGLGAWELAARIDGADLDGQGRLGRLTAAVNWHLTRSLRLGVNASHTEVEEDPLALGDLSVVFLRAQYAY